MELMHQQLGMLTMSDHQRKVAEQLIGSLDEDGYLRREINAIIDDLAFRQNIITSAEEVAGLLVQLQQFDPPGVGARSLQECLLLQLERKLSGTHEKPVSLAIKVLEKYFDEFIKKHYGKIQKVLNITDEELREVIGQITLRLDNDNSLDLHKKQRFTLDIDKFLKTEPGAIYRVTIGFRPEYSLYSKVDTSQKNNNEDEEYYGYYDDENSSGVDDDNDFWKRYDTYYPYGYNWERRDDPNSKSYYSKDRWATRNILASNIGLTAKRGNDNQLMVAVSSILTTEPLSGIDLEVLDYQQTIISKGKSSNDGFAGIEIKRKPYLLIAKKRK